MELEDGAPKVDWAFPTALAAGRPELVACEDTPASFITVVGRSDEIGIGQVLVLGSETLAEREIVTTS